MEDPEKFKEAVLDLVIHWTSVMHNEPDQHGAFRELVAFYKQATLNPEQSLRDALVKVWDETLDDDD